MTEIVEHLTVLKQTERDAIKAEPVTQDAFHVAFAALACLDQIERLPPPSPSERPPAQARIVFWNAERLKYPEPSVTLLRKTDADAILLCEADLGMARSGNRHTVAGTARALDAGYLYGVEFVELDLGDARERTWHSWETNVAGLHGAGLISRHPLARPELVRLERSGRWFDGAFGERRVGSRIAVMAELALDGGPVLLVSVHYESHTGPDDRLMQTNVLLDAIDRQAPGKAVLIGGDFNTSTFEAPPFRAPNEPAEAVREDPERLLRPMRYEPMFAEMASRGYDLETCNLIGEATQRTRPDGTPPPPHGRIDWFFARGLVCSQPETIPAVDAGGTAISDHEALAVTIGLRN